MFKKLLFSLIISPLILFAQNSKGIVTGNVFDNLSNKPLHNCNIFVLDENLGTVSDKDGKFELTLPLGNYKIRLSFVGYETVIKEIFLSQHSAEIEPSTNASYRLDLCHLRPVCFHTTQSQKGRVERERLWSEVAAETAAEEFDELLSRANTASKAGESEEFDR